MRGTLKDLWHDRVFMFGVLANVVALFCLTALLWFYR